MWRHLIVVLVVTGLVAPSIAVAQSSPSAAGVPIGQSVAAPAPAPDRRWSVIVDLLGAASAGPARDLEDSMRSAHFDDTLAGFSGPISSPTSGRDCQVVLFLGCGGDLPAFEVDRRLKRGPWSIAVLFTRTPVGEVRGYHAPFQFLNLEHRVDSLGALLSLGNRGGQIGIGPA